MQVVALETHDVSDQQFPVLCGHPNEAGMEAVRITGRLNRIKPQDFDRRFKKHAVGKEQREPKDFMGFVDCSHRHTDTSATEADGFLGERTFAVVRFVLNADGQNDGDAIKFAAFSS